jgi:hypothetical protein
MTTPEMDLQTTPALALDTAEIKKQVLYRDVDESLSEWERARMTSKTWSMEQD